MAPAPNLISRFKRWYNRESMASKWGEVTHLPLSRDMLDIPKALGSVRPVHDESISFSNKSDNQQGGDTAQVYRHPMDRQLIGFTTYIELHSGEESRQSSKCSSNIPTNPPRKVPKTRGKHSLSLSLSSTSNTASFAHSSPSVNSTLSDSQPPLGDITNIAAMSDDTEPSLSSSMSLSSSLSRSNSLVLESEQENTARQHSNSVSLSLSSSSTSSLSNSENSNHTRKHRSISTVQHADPNTNRCLIASVNGYVIVDKHPHDSWGELRDNLTFAPQHIKELAPTSCSYTEMLVWGLYYRTFRLHFGDPQSDKNYIISVSSGCGEGPSCLAEGEKNHGLTVTLVKKRDVVTILDKFAGRLVGRDVCEFITSFIVP